MKLRRSRGACALLLAAGMLTALPATAAQAAPTRYEAENATIVQGAVESNHAGFSGTGFVNGENVAGPYVEWTVNAPAAGTATLALRYANGTTANRPSDISVNGTLVADDRAFAPTGAWSTWTTSTLTATLQAGPNKIRATASATGGNPNWDFLDVETSAPTTEYQAESATISQGAVESNHPGYTGSGFVNLDNLVGSYVQWTVSSATAGTQGLSFRFANGTADARPMDISINGGAPVSLNFPSTGAWPTWQTVSLNAALTAGANTIRATSSTANGGPNLDKLDVTGPGDTEKPTAPGQPSCTQITHNSLRLDWAPSTDNIGVAGYDIFQLGTQIGTAAAPPHTLTGLQADFTYTISVFARDGSGNVSDSSPEVTCRTQPAPPDDPPTQPGKPAVTGVQPTQATLTWTASSDDNGVRAYLIRDASNTVLHTVTGTPPAGTAQVALECDKTYQLHVVARDTANQLSAPSAASDSFTTGSCGTVPQTPATVAGSWDIPWDISWAPDGSFALVTERDTF
ncbi:CBM35 domain-containing protein, partial [Nonomuraea sp. NPDC055795]